MVGMDQIISAMVYLGLAFVPAAVVIIPIAFALLFEDSQQAKYAKKARQAGPVDGGDDLTGETPAGPDTLRP